MAFRAHSTVSGSRYAPDPAGRPQTRLTVPLPEKYVNAVSVAAALVSPIAMSAVPEPPFGASR